MDICDIATIHRVELNLASPLHASAVAMAQKWPLKSENSHLFWFFQQWNCIASFIVFKWSTGWWFQYVSMLKQTYTSSGRMTPATRNFPMLEWSRTVEKIKMPRIWFVGPWNWLWLGCYMIYRMIYSIKTKSAHHIKLFLISIQYIPYCWLHHVTTCYIMLHLIWSSLFTRSFSADFVLPTSIRAWPNLETMNTGTSWFQNHIPLYLMAIGVSMCIPWHKPT